VFQGGSAGSPTATLNNTEVTPRVLHLDLTDHHVPVVTRLPKTVSRSHHHHVYLPRTVQRPIPTNVDIVRTTPEECLEGKHLKFKAHIRGWKTVTRERLCQSLLAKTEHNLLKALLNAPWKDILLVLQAWYPKGSSSLKALLNAPWKDILLVLKAWYPEHTPKYETQGWWYVPAEAVLGQTCKSCNAFCEPADFTGNKGKRQSQ
jgi:hypothetical protein